MRIHDLLTYMPATVTVDLGKSDSDDSDISEIYILLNFAKRIVLVPDPAHQDFIGSHFDEFVDAIWQQVDNSSSVDVDIPTPPNIVLDSMNKMREDAVVKVTEATKQEPIENAL